MPRGRIEEDPRTIHHPAEAERASSLNFKVTPAFKKEFKGYAVAQGISMTDLLKEGFALSKKKRGK